MIYTSYRLPVLFALLLAPACTSSPPPASSGRIQVYVVNAVGDPAANAQVTVLGSTAAATTNTTGDAVLEGVAPGPVVVQAVVAGGVPMFGEARVVSGATADVALQLPAVLSAAAPQSASGTTTVSVGGVQVVLPASGGLVTAAGTAYTGPVEVRMAALENGALPPLEVDPAVDGASERTFAPNVAFDVSMFAAEGTTAGQALQVAAGNNVTMRRPFVAGDPVATGLGNPGTLALRRYDAPTAAWVDAGSAQWDGATLVATLPHLSIYAGYSTAFYRATFAVPSACLNGRVLRAGQGVSEAVKLVYRIVVPSTASILQREAVARSGADGAYCLDVPQAGAAVAMEAWTAANPTRVRHTGFIQLRSFLVGGRPQPLPALPPAGSAESCGPTCFAGPTIDLAPVVALAPQCRANAALCDDRNPCTADTCSASNCPAGTSCSGCSSTPVNGGACDDGNGCTTGDQCVSGRCVGTNTPSPTIIAGEPSPPVFQTAAPARTASLANPFDAPPDPVLVRTDADGIVETYGGGDLRLTATALGPSTTAAWQYNSPTDAANACHGAGEVELSFIPAAMPPNTGTQLSIRLTGPSSAANAQLSANLSGGGYQFQAHVNATSAGVDTVALEAEQTHRIRIAVDAAGQATFQLTPAGGAAPIVYTAQGFSAMEPYRIEIAVYGASAVATGSTPLLRLTDLTTSCTVMVPERVTLNGSVLAYNGVNYNQDPENPASRRHPTVLWLDGMDAPAFVADAGMALEQFSVASPRPPVVFAELIGIQQAGVSTRVTFYTSHSRDEVSRLLNGLNFNPTFDGRFEAFRLTPAGAYAWVLPACP